MDYLGAFTYNGLRFGLGSLSLLLVIKFCKTMKMIKKRIFKRIMPT